jgi:predicted enzyme related to lactoylglutathione lyase
LKRKEELDVSLPKPGAVVFAQDVAKIAHFYATVLGMKPTHSEPELVVLESNAVQLVIHGVPAWVKKKYPISVPPLVREDTAVKLMFPVPSIALARAAAASLGGSIAPASKEFQARDFRACDGVDPEGNVIQFRQSAS